MKRYSASAQVDDVTGFAKLAEHAGGEWVKAEDAEEELRKFKDLIRSVRAATRAHVFILCKDGELRERGISLLDRMDAALGTNAAGEPSGGKG